MSDTIDRFREWMAGMTKKQEAAKAQTPAGAPSVPQDAEVTKRAMPGQAGMETDSGGQLAPAKPKDVEVRKVSSPFMNDAKGDVDIDLDAEEEDHPVEPLRPLWEASARAGENFRQNHPQAVDWLQDKVWKAQQAGREFDVKDRMDRLDHPDSLLTKYEDGVERARGAAQEWLQQHLPQQPHVRQPIQIDRHDDAEYVERVRKAMEQAGKK